MFRIYIWKWLIPIPSCLVNYWRQKLDFFPLLAFCYSIYDDIVRRRPKHHSDDEITTERKPKIDTKDNDEDRSISPNSSIVR